MALLDDDLSQPTAVSGDSFRISALNKEDPDHFTIWHASGHTQRPGSGDGMIERFNRTCLMKLSMFVNDRRDNWNELLPYVMHAYKTSVHESTGYSPFRLMMGDEGSLPQDVSTSELRTNREHDISPNWDHCGSDPTKLSDRPPVIRRAYRRAQKSL